MIKLTNIPISKNWFFSEIIVVCSIQKYRRTMIFSLKKSNVWILFELKMNNLKLYSIQNYYLHMNFSYKSNKLSHNVRWSSPQMESPKFSLIFFCKSIYKAIFSQFSNSLLSKLNVWKNALKIIDWCNLNCDSIAKFCMFFFCYVFAYILSLYNIVRMHTCIKRETWNEIKRILKWLPYLKPIIGPTSKF